MLVRRAPAAFPAKSRAPDSPYVPGPCAIRPTLPPGVRRSAPRGISSPPCACPSLPPRAACGRRSAACRGGDARALAGLPPMRGARPSRSRGAAGGRDGIRPRARHLHLRERGRVLVLQTGRGRKQRLSPARGGPRRARGVLGAGRRRGAARSVDHGLEPLRRLGSENREAATVRYGQFTELPGNEQFPHGFDMALITEIGIVMA